VATARATAPRRVRHRGVRSGGELRPVSGARRRLAEAARLGFRGAIVPRGFALMVHAAWGLLRDSGRILLEGAPEGIDLGSVRDHLLGTDHVQDVHDLHVWTVTSDLPTLSAHVVVRDHCFSDGHAPRVLDQLQDCLLGHFDVEHSTFQLEPAGHSAHEDGTH